MSGETTTAAVTATPAATTTETTTPATWFASFDDEMKGHIQNRGYDKLTPDAAAIEAIKAHRNAEKMLGVPSDRVLKLPEKLDGPEMAQIYDRLGRPASAKEYEIMTAAGEDDKFSEWAKSTFHELGLTKSQAKALSEKWNAHVTGEVDEMSKASQVKFDADVATLQKDWGQAYEQNRAIATGAREALGVSDEEVDAMGAVLGIKRTLELFHSIGTKTMEDTFQSSGNALNRGKIHTPAQAQARIADLQQDASFRKRLMDGETGAKSEWEALQKQAWGG